MVHFFHSYFDPESITWSWDPQHQTRGHEVSLKGFVVAIIASTELSCAMVGWLGWVGWLCWLMAGWWLVDCWLMAGWLLFDGYMMVGWGQILLLKTCWPTSKCRMLEREVTAGTIPISTQKSNFIEKIWLYIIWPTWFISNKSGWWFQSPWKILVKWDAHSQYMEK